MIKYKFIIWFSSIFEWGGNNDGNRKINGMMLKGVELFVKIERFRRKFESYKRSLIVIRRESND